jgi:hypothetical protein
LSPAEKKTARLEFAIHITGDRQTNQLYPFLIFGSLFAYNNAGQLA